MRAIALRAIVAAVLVAVPATLSAQAADSLSFVPPGQIVLTPADLPHKVVLRSYVKDTLNVRLRFYSLDTVTAPPVVLDTTVQPLPPLGTRTWTLNRGDLGGVQWPRHGYLVAMADGKGEADSVGITIHPHTVPVHLAGAPLDTWHAEVRRWTLFPALWRCESARWKPIVVGTCRRAMVIPVAAARTAAPGTEREQVIGFLTNDTLWRGTAVVVVERRDTMPGGAMGDRIRLAGLGGVGTYKGSVRLSPTTTITLNVLVTYGLLPAAIVIGLGILLSALLQRYAGRDRLLMLTRARILRFGVNAEGADAGFRREVGDHPVGGGYTIAEPARRVRDDLLAQLRQLALNNAAIDPDSDEYKKILTALDAPEKAVVTWPLAGRALRRVAEALARIASTARPAPTPLHTLPRVVQRAPELLAGRPLELQEVEAEHAKLRLWADHAEQWVNMNAVAAEFAARAQRLRDRGVPDADAVLNDLGEIWLTLWEADFGPDPAETLKAAREKVWAMESANPVEEELQMAGAAAPRDEKDPLVRAVRFEGAAPLPDPTALERRVRVLDNALSLLATLVAILVALNMEYFDGPVFGTPRDYLGAFLWAFSVKTGLEVLKVFGERVFLGLPFRAG